MWIAAYTNSINENTIEGRHFVVFSNQESSNTKITTFKWLRGLRMRTCSYFKFRLPKKNTHILRYIIWDHTLPYVLCIHVGGRAWSIILTWNDPCSCPGRHAIYSWSSAWRRRSTGPPEPRATASLRPPSATCYRCCCYRRRCSCCDDAVTASALSRQHAFPFSLSIQRVCAHKNFRFGGDCGSGWCSCCVPPSFHWTVSRVPSQKVS